MLKAYKFRLYPSKEQDKKLHYALALARFAYNEQLNLKIQS
ncbi:MAG: helix-turn-helix domain-containing protein, partial [Nanoarchaeota archaeon]|nr:helix-turn-helix domain-containing protein [Nanoarchaeota archaeon]